MARPRAAESPRSKSKTALVEEITRGMTKFADILATIDDCTKEGFPYRDGARAKAELQLRETIRRVFGERSPEYHAHRHHTLRISNPDETKESVTLIRSLVESLERKKLELQGIVPPARTSEPEAAPSQSKPQMTLGPPATSPLAPVTHNETPDTLTPPVIAPATAPAQMNAAPASGPPPMQIEPSPLWKMPSPAMPAVSIPIPEAHLTTSQFRAVLSAIQASTSLSSAQPTPTATSAAKPTPAQSAELVAALAPIWAATPPNKATTNGAPASPLQPAPAPALPQAPIDAARSSTPKATTVPPVQTETSATTPSLPRVAAAPSPAASIEQAAETDPDPLPALRKICTRFHAVARQLRLRKDYRSTLEVEDDYDLQDLLCALLKFEFEEVGSDEWTPPYTAGSPRTTLLIDKDRTAVIAKKTRPGLTAKELEEQVAADAQRYAARAHCTNLFCFIYDPEGRIGSPKRLETDLTSVSDTFTVDVLVAPK